MTIDEFKKGLASAFLHTLPVLTGYLFLGIAFGVLLSSKGYGVWWSLCMALLIYAGSMQFMAVGLMAAGFNPISCFFLTLAVNARHIFYGISMLERFRTYGRAKYYMIFALTDETFAVLCSAKPPHGVREEPFNLAVCVLNQLYWVVGCTAGGLLGTTLPFNTQGIDFVMTALFTITVLGQWSNPANRRPALIGFSISIFCRLLFGPQWFIIAAMAVMIAIFGVTKNTLGQRMNNP